MPKQKATTPLINEVVRPINAQDGDLLKVSAFKGIETGIFGTKVRLSTKKRSVAAFVPEWNPENCISVTSVCLRLSSRFYPSVRTRR